MSKDPNLSPEAARVLALFQSPKAHPMTRSEIARELGVAPKDRAALRVTIRELETMGKLEAHKGNRYGPPGPAKSPDRNTVTGTISFPNPDRSRNAWLDLDAASRQSLSRKGNFERLFVPARQSGAALQGDRVTATTHLAPLPVWQKHARGRGRGPAKAGENRLEAHVTGIVERKRTKFIGTLHVKERFAHVVPDDPLFGRDFKLEGPMPPDSQDGFEVLVELLAWDNPFQAPRVKILKVFGKMGDPGVDVLAIIHRFDLPLDFPPAVREEAEEVSSTISAAELATREDWRERNVFTIDPFDAKDFDDAICVTKLEGGGWELGVFIADVAHYVTPGTAMDTEARKRGNSVYLVDRVIPMLPEALSNGICSLVPNEDRLTHAAIMEFDAKGHRKKVRFAKTVIRSRRRFAYEEAFERLESPRPTAIVDDETLFRNELHEAWTLAGKLRGLRMAHGSLDLDFPEVRVVLDDKGKPVELKQVIHDASHQLIEEFMLAANEAVAELSKNRGTPSIYRIHEDPDVDKLFEFRELARSYHYEIGDLTLRSELQALLKAIRGKPEEHALKIGLLKSLKRAAYSEQPLGHYGLAKVNYTHFTSPIRRYADLVVHRVLEKLATREGPAAPLPRIAQMAEIGEHLSETERTAAEAESESRLMKQFEYLMEIANRDTQTPFEAVVTEVGPKGIFLELTKFYLRGMIRQVDLPRNEYFVEPQMQRVRDMRGRIVMAPGQKILVFLRRVDLERKRLDFALAE